MVNERPAQPRGAAPVAVHAPVGEGLAGHIGRLLDLFVAVVHTAVDRGGCVLCDGTALQP